MSIIPITVFFSLVLAGLFIALFAHEQRHRGLANAERDSLLPLADETPHAAGDDAASHDQHGGSGCGCRGGLRPPCAGCLKNHGRPGHASTL